MPKKKGSGKILSARFDGKAKKSVGDLKTSSCIVLISIQDKLECTGEYFAAIAQEAAKSYGKVTFLMVDTAYWHNLKLDNNSSSQELMNKAKALGDEWFAANENSFLALLQLKTETLQEYKTMSVDEKIACINTQAAILNKHFNIIRWSEWIKLQTQPAVEITQAYSVNSCLKEALEKTARAYAKRRAKLNPSSYPFYYNCALGYLVEESYPIMRIGAEQNYDFIAYPGSISPILAETWRFFVEPNYPAKMQWLHINFRKTQTNDTEFSTGQSNYKVPDEPSLAKNTNLFFAVNNLKQKLTTLPSQHQTLILTLSLALLDLLNSEGKDPDSTIRIFNQYTDLLITVSRQLLEVPAVNVDALSKAFEKSMDLIHFKP